MEEKKENSLVIGQTESLTPEQGEAENKEITGNSEITDTETKKPEEKEGKKPTTKEAVKKVLDKIVKEKADKREFLRQYIERYPGNKTFHVTSDNMVFLEKDLSLARLHQKSLSEGSVTSISVNNV